MCNGTTLNGTLVCMCCCWCISAANSCGYEFRNNKNDRIFIMLDKRYEEDGNYWSKTSDFVELGTRYRRKTNGQIKNWVKANHFDSFPCISKAFITVSFRFRCVISHSNTQCVTQSSKLPPSRKCIWFSRCICDSVRRIICKPTQIPINFQSLKSTPESNR